MIDLMRWRVGNVLYETLGIKTEIHDNIIRSNGGYITVCVTTPEKLNELGWRIRLAPSATFDRWANSVVIDKYFNTEDELVSYLIGCDTRVDIYKTLYESLSEEINDYRD